MALRVFCAALVFCLVAPAQTLSVDKLVSFLRSSVELKTPDGDIARYLKNVKLTDKLTDRTIEELLAAGIGPKTREALNTLRDRSANLNVASPTTPKSVEPKLPPVPDAAEQAE